jgi:hypothetical protein
LSAGQANGPAELSAVSNNPFFRMHFAACTLPILCYERPLT